jgi:hypothetical protein
MIFIPAFLIRNKEMLKYKDFKLKYAELYEGINTKNNFNLIYMSLYFVRRFGFLALVFVAPNFTGI